MSETTLAGVIPPIITALDFSGELDIASQEAVVARQLEAGASAIFLAGTTGEGAFLTPQLLDQLIDVVQGCVAGQVPVLVDALAPGTAQVIAIADKAAKAKADAVVVTAPYYLTASPAETEAHLRSVAKASSLPVLAYSIPPMTHQVMPLSVVEALFADDVVVGLKDSGHDLFQLLTAIDLGARYGKPVFSGYEPFAAEALKRGGAGIVASIGNVDPEGFADLWRAAQQDHWDLVEVIHARLIHLLDGFSAYATEQMGPTSGLISGIKAACQVLGVISERTVLGPFTRMPDSLLDQVRVQVRLAGLV